MTSSRINQLESFPMRVEELDRASHHLIEVHKLVLHDSVNFVTA
jgi:hypothetical protein